MLFGLCNAPATFEHLMEKVLQDDLSKIYLVYLNDVIVFSKSFEDMIFNLRRVFLRFPANLKINPKKCSFFWKGGKVSGTCYIRTRNFYRPGENYCCGKLAYSSK